MSATQRDKVLAMLQAAGPQGVSAHDLVYDHGITRGAAIMFSLRADGHSIATVNEGYLQGGRIRKMARYILTGNRADPMARCGCTHARKAHEGLAGKCTGVYLAAACPCSVFIQRQAVRYGGSG